jgi:hypothetical protein
MKLFKNVFYAMQRIAAAVDFSFLEQLYTPY